MSEDNLVTRVLQQGSELVKRKLKACEVHRDSTKSLDYDCYIKDKEPICESDHKISRFVKECYDLQEKLEIAVKALEFYATGNHYEDDRTYDYYRILDYGETAEEALAKIKEIK